jgi:hypothetical protein
LRLLGRQKVLLPVPVVRRERILIIHADIGRLALSTQLLPPARFDATAPSAVRVTLIDNRRCRLRQTGQETQETRSGVVKGANAHERAGNERPGSRRSVAMTFGYKLCPDGRRPVAGDKLLEVKLNDQERRAVGRLRKERKALLIETTEDTTQTDSARRARLIELSVIEPILGKLCLRDVTSSVRAH